MDSYSYELAAHCLSRIAWLIGYLTLSVFAAVVAFATYGMWKRRRNDD
jgi:hypothetical protein